LRKWKNTTNFALGYSIPAVAVAKAPRLWQDPRTKKYFGGEDPMEWADNNHPVIFKLGLVRLVLKIVMAGPKDQEVLWRRGPDGVG
jgi:hypothetical protein